MSLTIIPNDSNSNNQYVIGKNLSDFVSHNLTKKYEQITQILSNGVSLNGSSFQKNTNIGL